MIESSRLRFNLKAAAASATVLLLASCDPLPPSDGPVAVREGSDGIEFAICASTTLSHILVTYEAPLGEPITALKRDTRQVIVPGDFLDTKGISMPSPDLASGSEIYLVLNSSTGTIRGRFLLEEPLDELWLHTDGTRDEVACRGETPSSK